MVRMGRNEEEGSVGCGGDVDAEEEEKKDQRGGRGMVAIRKTRTRGMKTKNEFLQLCCMVVSQLARREWWTLASCWTRALARAEPTFRRR